MQTLIQCYQSTVHKNNEHPPLKNATNRNGLNHTTPAETVTQKHNKLKLFEFESH